MWKQLKLALVVTKREIRDQFRDWRIIIPILALTLFFPFLMNYTAQRILSFVEEYGATIIADRLVPFLLMIVGFFPISVSLVIALDSFVGEKERGSIEPLLISPLEDWQLYFGKLIAVTFPPLMASYVGMGVYILGLVFKGMVLPESSILIQIFVLTTVQAVMMVAAAVIVSSQSTSIRAANLLASFIVIPVALLIQGESMMMFWGTNGTLWWAVFGLSVLTLLLVRVGLAQFNREELLGRELDVLRVGWMWRTFISQFIGQAKSLKEWFLKEIPRTLASLRLPIFLCVLLAVIGFLAGYQQINEFAIELDEIGFESLNERLDDMLEFWPLFSVAPVLSIFWQNVRALLIAMVLGGISLGILGSLPLIFSMGIAGYLMALLSMNGISTETYFWFLLPHGVIEIPAVIIATAGILRVGALFATPDSRTPVSEILIRSVADWVKIMLALVIPLLFIASAVEVWFTPRIVLWLVQ